MGNVYHAYVTGMTNSAWDFPTTPGALQHRRFGGATDVFVTQLNATGSALVYSTFLGGNGEDEGSAIAVDAVGNAYLTGSTAATATIPNNFPIRNAFQPTYGGAWANAFVAKLNRTGSALIYASYMGGRGDILTDGGHDIAVDAGGYAYLTGYTKTRPNLLGGPRFPIVQAFQPAHGGGVGDTFVTKVSPQGALVYSSYLGGSGEDFGNGIALDTAGNVYVTGSTTSEDFPVRNAFQAIPGGSCPSSLVGCEIFVTKISADVSADLSVAALAAPNTARAGTRLTVTDTTTNQGGGPAGASTTTFYLSTNATMDAADVVLGRRSVPALAPGTISTGVLTVTIPPRTRPGTYFLLAHADAPQRVPEANEGNNVRARVLTLP